MTGTFATVEDAFRAFRADPVERLRVKIRRLRAEQIRSMAEQPNTVTIDQFNRDVWSLESATRVDGNEVSKGWLIDTGGGLTSAEAADLDRALDEGRVEFHGNYTWKSGSGVYAPGKDDPTRQANARSALRLLSDKTLAPAEKARQIDDLPGFGDCAATGLVMLAHPNDFAIYNGPSVAAVKAFGLPADKPAEFQASVRALRDRLGASDFIELDWFLYLLNQQAITVGPMPPTPPLPTPPVTGSTEYWVIALGEGGRLWKECRDAGIIAIGWDQLGDLRQYGTKEDFVTKLAAGRGPDAPRPTNDSHACYEFCRTVKPGDVVFVKKGTRQVLGAGHVTGVNAAREVQRLPGTGVPNEKCSAPVVPLPSGVGPYRVQRRCGRRRECTRTWSSGPRSVAGS